MRRTEHGRRLGDMSERRLGFGVFAAVVMAATMVSADNIPGDRPPCVVIYPHSWNAGPGWNHLVTVTNHCAYAVHCQITTNANPAPTMADVAAGGEETVNTFLYSPIQGFQPTANCSQR